MNLEDIVSHLGNARIAHLRWVERAEALVKGLPLDKAQVPVLSTDCIFGQWYHGEGRALSTLTSYAALDAPHKKLHGTYQDIFKLLYGDDDRSMLGKLFGSSKSYKKDRVEDAAALLPRLKTESKAVLQALELLEREVTIRSKAGVFTPEGV